MAQRYARIDVDFMHKNTARKLTEQLGVVAPLVFIALILRAKDGNPPGTFSYATDTVGWEKLGFDPEAMPFTLDEFFTATGRLKQTSRRRNGRVWNVFCTRYGQWQQESRRYEEAVRKARKRAQTPADTKRTQGGTASGRKVGPRSRSRSTPLPPKEKIEIHPHDCRVCGARQPSRSALEDHLRIFHPDQQDAAAA